MLIIPILIGIAAGGLSGLLGIGGGAVVVPSLVLGLGTTQHLAQGVSLAVIIPTALTGLWTFHRKGLIMYKTAGIMAVGAIFGVLISSFYVHLIPSLMLKKYFGFFLAIVGLRMLMTAGIADKKVNPCQKMEDTNEE
jgi:uncharacterized membrane protein YfcA